MRWISSGSPAVVLISVYWETATRAERVAVALDSASAVTGNPARVSIYVNHHHHHHHNVINSSLNLQSFLLKQWTDFRVVCFNPNGVNRIDLSLFQFLEPIDSIDCFHNDPLNLTDASCRASSFRMFKL